MSLPEDIGKAIWKIIAPLLSKRGQVIILLLVLCALASFYIQHEQIPSKLFLIPGLCLIAIVFYMAFEQPAHRVWIFPLAAVLLVCWGFWYENLATRESRDVRELMADAARLNMAGNSDGSIKRYEEASAKAEQAKLYEEQMDCLLELGDLRYLRSEYEAAKKNLQSCQELSVLKKFPRKQAAAMSRLGDIARFEGNTQQASQLLNAALQIFQTSNDILGEARARRGLGDVELRRNATRSREYFERARQLFIQAQDQNGEADAMAGLGDLNSLVGRTTDARANYNQALDLYRKHGQGDGQGDIYRGLGDLERGLGNFDEAEQAYHQADGFYRTANDVGGLADVYRGLGDWAQVKAPAEEARQKYTDALQLFFQVGDRNGQAQVYLGLGELDQLADPKASRASYMLAYRIYLNTESKEGQGTALRHLGDLDASLNQEAPARQNYEQATGAYKHVNNQIGQAEVLKSTGNLERKLGNVEAARTDYRAAFELYRSMDHPYGQAQIEKVLGDLETAALAKTAPEAKQAKIAEAQQYYISALKIFEDSDSKLGQAYTLKRLSLVKSQQNNVDEAVKANRRAEELFSDMGIAAENKSVRDFQVASPAIKLGG